MSVAGIWGGGRAFPSIATDTDDGIWHLLAGVTLCEPTSLVLQVQVDAPVEQNPDIPSLPSPLYMAWPVVSPGILPLTVGTQDFTEATMQGALRLTYGAHGVLQQRVMDVRSGSYQLPPCHTARVEVSAYNRSGLAASLPYSVGASLAPGHVAESQEPTVSGVRVASAGGAAVTMPYMQGCRYVRVGITSDSGISEDIQLTLAGVQPVTQIDYSAPSWANQVPDLVPVWVGDPASLLVVKAGTDGASLWAQQVLRL